jgi:hypothetical protein
MRTEREQTLQLARFIAAAVHQRLQKHLSLCTDAFLHTGLHDKRVGGLPIYDAPAKKENILCENATVAVDAVLCLCVLEGRFFANLTLAVWFLNRKAAQLI